MREVDVLRRMERAYVKGVQASPDAIKSGPFLISINPTSNMVWLNNAVLEDENAPINPQLVEAMMAVFLERERTPRMELFKELRPELVACLQEVGFTTESETPVLVCEKSDFRPFTSGEATAEWVTADSDPVPFLKAVDSAFGGDPDVTPERIERFRQGIRRGSSWAAQAKIGGTVVGGASLMPSEGAAELAGVGTHPDHRRKGAALAVSSFLMSEFFKTGDVVWLSAADDAARAVYEKLGFQFVGTQVNISYPPKEPAT